MTVLTGTLSLAPALTLTGDTDVGSAPSKVLQDALATLTIDGSDLAPDILVADLRTLATGASETHDLTAIAEALAGKSVTLAKIYALAVIGVDANTTDLTVGAAASNAWVGPMGGTAPTVTVPAGAGSYAAFVSSTGWVVDSTHKSLKVANASGATASYYLVIIGES